jgi:hypothetical protein
MDALMDVVSLAHEHSCDEGDMDLIHSVKLLLTSEDMERFTDMCEEGGHGCGRESAICMKCTMILWYMEGPDMCECRSG